MGVCGIFPRVRDGAPAEGRERATVTRPLSQEEVTTLVPNDAVRDLLTRVLDWENSDASVGVAGQSRLWCSIEVSRARKNTRTFTLRPDWEMMEYSCEENNKSLWEGRIKVPKYNDK